jgi:phospholipase/carboxylesterase
LLHHLAAHPREPIAEPYPCLVLLHGRGSNEQDLFGLVPELPKKNLVVSVRAPNTFPFGGFYWYDIEGQAAPIQETLDDALGQLRNFVAALPAQYPIDPARVYVLGFSQGALMAGCLMLSDPQLVAAAVMLSGYLPLTLELTTNATGIAGKPIFMAHGTYDNVLPVTLGRQARLHLEGLHAAVEYHEYAMDHQVSMDELSDLNAWFGSHGLQ